MEGLKPGQFYYNGINSIDKGLVIESRPVIETPQRIVDFLSPDNGFGDHPYDRNTYKNTTLELKLLYRGNGRDDITNISNARSSIFEMFDTGKYVPFIGYFDPSKVYMVMPKEGWSANFENLYWYNGAIVFELELTVQPYKTLDTNDSTKRTYTSNFSDIVLQAPNFVKKGWPIIKIIGEGNCDVVINGVNYRLQYMKNNITIDSWSMWTYTESMGGIQDQYSKAYFKEYPTLNSGRNTVSIIPRSGGTVTQVEITPGWRLLV